MTLTADPDAAGRGGNDLDPDIRRFVREMGAAWSRHPDLATVSPAEARRIAELVRAPWTRGGPVMAAVTERVVPTAHGAVRLRFYDPGPEGVKPVLVYLHGGGWTLFSLDTHDRVMRELAARSGATVVGVDYALSPEVKFPVALEQVCAVIRFVRERGPALGLDPTRIAVGGDSAGGNLAVVAVLRMRTEGDAALVRALALVYPVLDRISSPQAQARYGGSGYMLGADEMERFWSNYLRSEGEAGDPLVSPLRADLSGLPPTLLVVPECDLLSEQSLRMAERLRAARVAVELKLYPGASHSFLEAVSIAPLADRALTETAQWLRTALAEGRR
jgi:acetyl esterase